MSALHQLFGAFAPHLLTAALYALRLLPVAILCPLFGGPLVPSIVRFSLAAGFGAAAYVFAGADPIAMGTGEFIAAAGKELCLGTAMGFLSALPFEAARAGGRLADTLRGATLSELHVPLMRQRETAVGDLLAQWLVVLAACGGGDKLVFGAVMGAFRTLPVGLSHGLHLASITDVAVRGSGDLLATALCLGAPAGAGVLAADVALALATRAAPSLGVASVAQPARAGLGLLGVAVSASVLMGKLMAVVAASSGLVSSLR